MKLKKKKVPNWLTNRLLADLYQSKFGIITTNWLNQGMTYMLFEEVLLKIVIDVFIFGVASIIFSLFYIDNLTNLVISFFIAHTINWLINGHFFNLIRYLGYTGKGHNWLLSYPEKMKQRLQERKAISAIAIFGSISRKNSSHNSDVDLRVVSQPGLINALLVSWFVFTERFFAFFEKFPIDVFMVTQTRGLEKLRADEPPIILFDNSGFLKQYYDSYILYEDLKKS